MDSQKNGDFYDDGNQGYDGYVNQLAQPPDAESAARQQEEWKQDLGKLEEEIQTLRSVLSVKIREANVLKKKLGYTPLGELKADLQYGYQAIKGSEVVQKTNTALQSFGAYASRKFGDIRNSNAMKSMENKFGDAYSSVKYKMGVTTSAGNISEYNGPSTSAAAASASAGGAGDRDTSTADKEKLPEDKSPL